MSFHLLGAGLVIAVINVWLHDTVFTLITFLGIALMTVAIGVEEAILFMAMLNLTGFALIVGYEYVFERKSQ